MKTQPTRGYWIALSLILLLLIFFAAGFIYQGFRTRTLGTQSEAWPTVSGVIVSSELQSRSKIIRDLRTQRRKNWKPKREITVYQPKIVYRYTVDGQTYTQTRLNVSGGASESKYRSTAEKILAKYPPGSQVTVYYNPENPEEAVLQPGSKQETNIGFFVVGFICFGLAGIVGYMGIKSPPIRGKAAS